MVGHLTPMGVHPKSLWGQTYQTNLEMRRFDQYLEAGVYAGGVRRGRGHECGCEN